MLINDVITAAERLSNPFKKLVREEVKSALLAIVLLTSFLVIFTQPGGLI